MSPGVNPPRAPRLRRAVIWCAAASLMLLTWWLAGVVLPAWMAGTDANPAAARGDFGDQFGAINALFSGCALLGVVIALGLQSRQLAEASRQHSQLLGAQIVMEITDAIRGEAWGDAHQELANFRRRHGQDHFVSAYLKAHLKKGRLSRIGKARRCFNGPLAKLAALKSNDVATLEVARLLFSQRSAATYVFVVHELELALAAKHGSVGSDGLRGVESIKALAMQLHPGLQNPFKSEPERSGD